MEGGGRAWLAAREGARLGRWKEGGQRGAPPACLRGARSAAQEGAGRAACLPKRPREPGALGVQEGARSAVQERARAGAAHLSRARTVRCAVPRARRRRLATASVQVVRDVLLFGWAGRWQGASGGERFFWQRFFCDSTLFRAHFGGRNGCWHYSGWNFPQGEAAPGAEMGPKWTVPGLESTFRGHFGGRNVSFPVSATRNGPETMDRKKNPKERTRNGPC